MCHLNSFNCRCHHLPKIGCLITRLGLTFVVIWFGVSQIQNSAGWVDMVPDWAVNLTSLPPLILVIINGWLELIAGLILACGFFIGPVALFLSAHIFIIALSIGFNSVAVRDFGLAAALFGLGLTYLPDLCRCKKTKKI